MHQDTLQNGLPAEYTSRRVRSPFPIDGDLTKPAWQGVPKSPRFVDMVSGEPAFFDTRMASLWDENNLYLAYWLEEPALRATMTERDSLVWFDNDVELFLDGEDCYYELEINTLNTVYEVFFIYQDALKRGTRFDTPEFDLYQRDVDVLCGFQDSSRYKKHPRGKRWAFMDWDYPGLRTAVQTAGTINDPSTVDQGWTVEIALPWEGLKKLLPSRSFPPAEGDSIRAAFFRFEALRYHNKTVAESPGWALSPHGVYDSHIPEKFSYLHFTEA
ncbi:conserved hypothetical protein [Treponema primitia ZAS-2]|uniref:Uncharacterized protein n=1 Tax=Treponema primitia (strain ATCC BAA-887 / DSM 12427 / ZAS-2) TaxID=545694 RepID=F5YQ58_TREPZ|nr:carbohydrate-binding family 9-like protein [Treponema primitia]AEF84778.1 conserved hypothetical protein [Treponema primitia ZAS-2]